MGMSGQIGLDIQFLVGDADLFPPDLSEAAPDRVDAVLLAL